MKENDMFHLDRAINYWEGLDKEDLGESDVPELIYMIDMLFTLVKSSRGGPTNGNSSTSFIS